MSLRTAWAPWNALTESGRVGEEEEGGGREGEKVEGREEGRERGETDDILTVVSGSLSSLAVPLIY